MFIYNHHIFTRHSHYISFNKHRPTISCNHALKELLLAKDGMFLKNLPETFKGLYEFEGSSSHGSKLFRVIMDKHTNREINTEKLQLID